MKDGNLTGIMTTSISITLIFDIWKVLGLAGSRTATTVSIKLVSNVNLLTFALKAGI